MIEITALRCMRTREDYDKYYSAIPLTALTKETQILITDISRYYSEHPDHDRIDFILFRDMFFSVYHRTLSADKRDYYEKVLRRVDVDVCDSAKHNLINSLIELDTATELSDLIDEYQAGGEVSLLRQVEYILNNAGSKSVKPEARTYEQPNFETLMDQDADGSGLPWEDSEFAKSVRSLRGGDFIIFAARPDQGKTSWIAAQTAHMSSHCPKERPVLWLSNEGVRDGIVRRSITAALKSDVRSLVRRQQAGTLQSDYFAAIGHAEAIQIEDICGWSNYEVQDLIELVNPSLVIMDMIDKVKFLGIGKDARTDQKLEEMYSWFRELGIKMDYATIATSQVSAEGAKPENSAYPADHMLKDSKTGKQGACDAIIMMGHDCDPLKKWYRYFSAPKNKLKIPGAGELNVVSAFNPDTCEFKKV